MSTSAVGVQNERAPGFWGSTNGKKAVMAVTGAILFLFVIGHLARQPAGLRGSGEAERLRQLLHELGELLWPVRILLLDLRDSAHHRDSAAALLKKRAGRWATRHKKAIASSYASRTMYWSGPIVLAFVIFHLLHLTAGYYHPGAAFIEGDVYHNVVAGFQVWWVSVWYIFSMILLGLHLRHGIWSMFQSLGHESSAAHADFEERSMGGRGW